MKKIQDEVAMEGATGKLYRASFHDREGRIVLVLRPGMQVPWVGLDVLCLTLFREKYLLWTKV